jgi:predicted patatin/cPLA2 family phospholipase
MDTQQRFEELKRKYAGVLQFLDGSQTHVQQMDIQDGKLMIRAAVSSPEIRDRVLAEIEQIDGSFDDVIPDIRIEGQPNLPATGQTTVNAGGGFSQQGEQPR